MNATEGGQGRRHLAYVMYWGALEPVGLATAVPTVLGLAETFDVTLVSFEKDEDRAQAELHARQRARLDERGVRWVALRYRPGYRATALDVVKGLGALWRVHRERPLDVIEGRTFVGGLVGAMASRLLGVPFLYHTEGCWVEEQHDVGRLGDASPVLRALRTLDRWIALQAGAVVAITKAGADMLRTGALRSRPSVPVLVVPTTSVLVSTALDVRRSRVIEPGDPVRALYSGSATGRYLLDELLVFIAALVRRRPGSTFTLLAHRDREVVRDAVSRHGLQAVTTLGAVPHDELPEWIRAADVGFFFLKDGPSAPCVSPTKIPEYLGHGVPLVCTRASGDGAGVVEGARAGVILEDPSSPEEREAALDSLDILLQDPDRGARAQAAARDFYALDRAIEGQRDALQRLAEAGR